MARNFGRAEQDTGIDLSTGIFVSNPHSESSKCPEPTTSGIVSNELGISTMFDACPTQLLRCLFFCGSGTLKHPFSTSQTRHFHAEIVPSAPFPSFHRVLFGTIKSKPFNSLSLMTVPRVKVLCFLLLDYRFHIQIKRA